MQFGTDRNWVKWCNHGYCSIEECEAEQRYHSNKNSSAALPSILSHFRPCWRICSLISIVIILLLLAGPQLPAFLSSSPLPLRDSSGTCSTLSTVDIISWMTGCIISWLTLQKQKVCCNQVRLPHVAATLPNNSGHYINWSLYIVSNYMVSNYLTTVVSSACKESS